MSQFKLQQDVFTQSTRIPNCFIEQYMPKAAGEFVKTYIYLLKCIEEGCAELSVSMIADALESSEKDVRRALRYWEKKGLLRLTFEGDVLTSLRLISFAETGSEPEKVTVSVSAPAQNVEESAARKAKAPARKEPETAVNTKAALPVNTEAEEVEKAPVNGEAAAPVNTEAAAPSEPQKRQYTPQEIAAFSEQDEITLLLYSIQKYLGKALSGADLNTVLFFYDTLHFPVDVIEYLFEYCVSAGHRNMRYIEKTAIGWAEDGIKTLSAAKKMNGIFSDNCYPVLRAFGLSGRRPSKGEAAYVSKWSLSYGFSLEMILEACNRTMDAIHQPSFEYADSILKRWQKSGVSTMDELKTLDEKREQELLESAQKKSRKKSRAKSADKAASNQFNNFEQRTYDYSELEERLFKV